MSERLLTSSLQKGLRINNLGITVEEWRTLFYLWKEDGVNQRDLASRASKEKSTMTRQINALERKGLITRNSYNKDKRNKLIFLTEKGKGIEEIALNTARNITNKAEEGINENDLKIFKKVIEQIISNI